MRPYLAEERGHQLFCIAVNVLTDLQPHRSVTGEIDFASQAASALMIPPLQLSQPSKDRSCPVLPRLWPLIWVQIQSFGVSAMRSLIGASGACCIMACTLMTHCLLQSCNLSSCCRHAACIAMISQARDEEAAAIASAILTKTRHFETKLKVSLSQCWYVRLP